MSKIKIRSFFTPKGNKNNPTHCRLCGSLLRDELSKARGYGRKCFKKIPIIVTLEIIPEKESK
jgi:hypothetical protein